MKEYEWKGLEEEGREGWGEFEANLI